MRLPRGRGSFDVIKTRVQLEPEFAGGGVLDNARTLVAEEGKSVLLRGLGSTIAGFAVHGALKYGGFEGVKYAIFHATVPSPPSPSTIDSPPPPRCRTRRDGGVLGTLPAGAGAHQDGLRPVASNFAAATARLFADEGVDGVFRSLPPYSRR